MIDLADSDTRVIPGKPRDKVRGDLDECACGIGVICAACQAARRDWPDDEMPDDDEPLGERDDDDEDGEPEDLTDLIVKTADQLAAERQAAAQAVPPDLPDPVTGLRARDRRREQLLAEATARAKARGQHVNAVLAFSVQALNAFLDDRREEGTFDDRPLVDLDGQTLARMRNGRFALTSHGKRFVVRALRAARILSGAPLRLVRPRGRTSHGTPAQARSDPADPDPDAPSPRPRSDNSCTQVQQPPFALQRGYLTSQRAKLSAGFLRAFPYCSFDRQALGGHDTRAPAVPGQVHRGREGNRP